MTTLLQPDHRFIGRSQCFVDTRHIFRRKAAILARRFDSLDRLAAATVAELDEVPEIGLTVAESVRDWFDDPGNRALANRVTDKVMHGARIPLLLDCPAAGAKM